MERRWVLLVVLPLAFGSAICWAEADQTSRHETVLKAAGLKSDPAALLDFFRNRTLSEAESAKLSALMRELGDDSFAVRTRASNGLVAAGRKAIRFLRAGVDDADPEVAFRSRRCLEQINAGSETSLVASAAALTALRKPPGAVETLLAYLPFREEEEMEQPLMEAIAAVGVSGGKIAPALRTAIKSKSFQQRWAAAWVLGRLGKAEDRALVLPLLHDAEPVVRFRAAEALVRGGDKRGVPALLALLEKGPLTLAGEAEGVLGLLAEEKAAAVSLGREEAQRKKCRQAWGQWWQEQGVKLDLTKLDLAVRLIGLRLVAANSGYGGKGAVWEYGADRKNRWEQRDVGGPFDARVLVGGRLLIAEYDAKRVTERDRTGKILWEFAAHRPLEVQRLANGNTLIVTNYDILEVTRAKTVVFTFSEKSGNIFSGQKLSNGHILYGLYTGAIVELDRAGKEVNRFDVERPRGLANIEVLPGGKYLLPLAGSNRIVELDRKGKVLREVSISSPTCAVVLPGGNLLVGSHIMNSVREIDRKGVVLWEQKSEGQIFRVRVR